ncbi:MAG: hypothetical protein CM15mP84_11240 [Cellvibrionales bacterium]|nr:MAG: hypothetical protein CM15mP84_11240 [Cellvibrionales bacterium]
MLAKFAAALAPFWERTMPRVGATGASDLMTFGKLGLKLPLGKEDMLEFFRVATLPMRDLLDEHFSDERLKAALCWDALVGSQLAPIAQPSCPHFAEPDGREGRWSAYGPQGRDAGPGARP